MDNYNSKKTKSKQVRFDHKLIEEKWQRMWRKKNIYKADDKKLKKFYTLVELTYTSGDLHMGHWFAWTAPDAFARMKRMQGYNVLFPVGGFDAFGLPAENAAIKHGIHPREWTYKNMDAMRAQFEKMGPSFDWDKEVITSDPDYYKWTQWLFLKLYQKGLAYRGKVWSNWCPECKTVLANEHVENGCCWRHTGTPVEQKLVDQWLFKITDYADKLIWPLDSFDSTQDKSARGKSKKSDWPQAAIDGQNNWIGKSKGLTVDFKLKDTGTKIPVWTKFWETIFGTTFLVLSPEHPLLEELQIPSQYKKDALEYIKVSKSKTEKQRKEETGTKTGVFTGLFAENPANGADVPIWIADYVLISVGTGAVMGVPAHDVRDFEFARKYDLEIVPVVVPVREYIDENAKDYYIRRSQIHKDLLVDLAKQSYKEGKKLMVSGGWAVYLQVGSEFRDFEDLDLIVFEDDLAWWKKALASRGLTISNMFPEGKNPRYYFQATKKDTHVDVSAIKTDRNGNIVWLEESNPKTLEKRFNQIFEAKKIDGVPVFALNKDLLYQWKSDIPAGKTLRWKEKADFMFMGFQSYDGDGVLIDSGQFDGMSAWGEGKEKMAKWMIKEGFAEWQTTYHLRDWSVSRRRYWAAPVPIVYCRKCREARGQKSEVRGGLRLGVDYTVLDDGKEYMIRSVPEADLPVTLPENVDYMPTGKAPLATATEWVKVACPLCKKPARREVETLDTYVDSSWYFFRYPSVRSVHSAQVPFDPKITKEWMPIEVYFGGPEHILGHTLYARFITKFLHDEGYIGFDEFAKKRIHHGVILGSDGYRMSKSRGNVVNPDEQVEKFGADAVRLCICFMGPHDKGGAWTTEGIEGSYRFLNRIWRLFSEKRKAKSEKSEQEIISKMHQTIKKVTEDIERLHTHTAIAALMEFVNLLEKSITSGQSSTGTTGVKARATRGTFDSCDTILETLCLLIAPFAPHLAEEIWVEILKQPFSVHKAPWPKYDEKLIVSSEATIIVQVNGKLRGQLTVSSKQSTVSGEIERLAKDEPKVAKWLEGKKIRRMVFIPGKLINFVLE